MNDNQKLTIDLQFGKLVVEQCPSLCDGDPDGFSITLQTESSGSFDGVQDIACVRPSKTGEKIECLVWADCNNEDYTNKYEIDKYFESEENNV